MDQLLKWIRTVSIMINVFLFNGPTDQTTSANCGGKRLRGERCLFCFFICNIIDTFIPNHCWRAYKKYMTDQRKKV